jgi:hypothetical protein
MKNLVVMAFALILGIFVLGSGQRPAHAGAAAAAITATQSETVKGPLRAALFESISSTEAFSCPAASPPIQ